MRVLTAIVILAVVAGGCSPRKRTPAEAALITTNMTLQQVVDKMGECHQVLRGPDGLTEYSYELTDGSVVIFDPERPFALTNRIQAIQFFRGTNIVHLP
jgi:hypothetical protein